MSDLIDPYDRPQQATPARPMSPLVDPYDRPAQPSALAVGTGDAEAASRGYKAVGKYKDGTIYMAPGGGLEFISPGFSTADPQTIANIMEGSSRAYAPKVDTAEGGLRSAYNGYTFGKGDEIVAGINATVDRATGKSDDWNESYDARLASLRGGAEQFREEQPTVAGVTEFAGAIPTALALGGGATSGPMAVRMGQSGLMGGAAGMDYGFSTGEGGFENRLSNAVEAAVPASILGLLAPPLGVMGGATVNALKRGGAAKEAGMTPATYDMLARGIQPDGSLSSVGRFADPEAMLADVSPNAMQMLDAAVASGGRASSTARQALDERTAKASTRVSQAIDEALGQPMGVASTERGIRQGTADARQAAYEKAYGQPIDYSSPVGREIDAIIRDRVPMSAITKANALMRAEGNRSAQIMASIGEDGTVVYERLPDVRQIDYITRALNEVAENQNAKGKLGGTTPLGNAYSNLSRDLRDMTREAAPEYGEALETAADPIQARNALRLGEKILTRNMTRDEVAEATQRMTGAERDFTAGGIRAHIDENLANVKQAFLDKNMDAREAAKALKDLSSRSAREKVALVVGQDIADRLFSELDLAADAFTLRASVAANSKTAPRKIVDDAVRARTEDGVVNAALSAEPLNAGKRMIQSLTGRTAADKSRMADDTYSEMVDALLRRGPEAQKTLQSLSLADQVIQPGAERASRLVEILLRKAAASSAPTIQVLR